MTEPKSAEPAVKRTLVEEGTEIKGSFSSSCPILVRGKIIGDVVAPSLEVSATGAVHGRVKVGQIRSQGELSGEIDADLVQLSGTIKDKTVVRAKSLEVKLASPSGRMQVMFGECVLDVGDAPSKEAAVASAARDVRAPSPAPGTANGAGTRPPPRQSERAVVAREPVTAPLAVGDLGEPDGEPEIEVASEPSEEPADRASLVRATNKPA